MNWLGPYLKERVFIARVLDRVGVGNVQLDSSSSPPSRNSKRSSDRNLTDQSIFSLVLLYAAAFAALWSSSFE